MITRRQLMLLLGASLATPWRATAQSRVIRIGFLSPAAGDSRSLPRVQAIREGLRDYGYIEGSNLQFELRWADGKRDRLTALATELVAMKVDAIIVVGTAGTAGALAATKTIPIIMATSSDPVADGHAASLARPGGNVTGLSSMSAELGAKRLQLLKEVFPKLLRSISVMWNSTATGMRARFEEARLAAPKLGLDVRSIEVRNLDELESAFASLSKEPPDALVLVADPFTASQRARIVDFVAARHIPTVYDSSDFADAGGLMSYGPDVKAQFRRTAYYVDRIVKGAKAGDLPIEQPAQFEFVVNLKAARALGLKIPDSILLQATRVIE